ncbi:MAG TPA: HepT-like ribonuclease domain-containing protein [Planctomycetota bacterium]|nr:HepT-like ribonuclease domain-containing protein [Planctomycetota bacterium]
MKEFDLELAARLPDARSIVGFRNVLVHSYERIDVEIVWQAIQTRIPVLRQEVGRLLSEISKPAN